MSPDPEGDDDKPERRELGKSLEFLRLIWELHHLLGSGSKQMKLRMGVTGLQRLAIRIVGRYPGISAGEVAELLHVHPSTLTGVFQKLEKKAYLVRSTDPSDARRSVFMLTAQGKRIDRAKQDTIESSVRRALAKLAPDKVDAAREALSALSAAIKEDWPSGPSSR